MPTLQSILGAEPVTLAEAQLAARVDGAELDDEIDGLITAARESAEQITGRCYCQQVLRESLADWPAATIAVHAASACAISYWTGSAWATLAEAAYVFAPAGAGTVVVPALGTSWPALGDVAAGPRVRIDLTAGPASPAVVPESVKLYIRASVAAWLETPAAQRVSNLLTANPLFERLLDRERLWA